MLGTIIEGTRSHALEIMVAGQDVAVHETFGPGGYFEFDAHKELFVDADGCDVTEKLFSIEAFLEGWHTWNDEDEIRENEYIAQMDAERAAEEVEQQRRADANVGGYSMRDFTAAVFSDDSHIFYRLAKNGNTGRALIKGFRLTVESKVPSVEYLIRYDTTGCQEWLKGTEVFASKLDLTASVMGSL